MTRKKGEGDEVGEFIESSGMTRAEVAQILGISDDYLRKIVAGQRTMGTDVRRRWTLLSAGVDPDGLSGEHRRLLLLYDRAPRAVQRAILSVLRSVDPLQVEHASSDEYPAIVMEGEDADPD